MAEFQEIVLGRTERGKKTALLVTLIVATAYLVMYRGPAEGYWDTYISVPAALITGEVVDFRSQSGQATFSYELQQRLPDDLVAPQSFGIATKDQRIGAAVLAAPFFKSFGVFGFRLFHAFVAALAALLMFIFVQGLTGTRWAALVGALLLVFNPFVLSFQNLNANLATMTMVCALFVLLETSPLRPFVIGLLFGAMGGVRNMAVIYAPLLVVWVFLEAMANVQGKQFLRRIAGLKAAGFFVLGAFLAILPFTYWKEFAFGSPFAHPSQFPHFQGFRPTFEHSLVGLNFEFNGLLNFPFADHWIRTPHFPFPVFLMIPMVFIGAFGILLFGTGMLGVRPLSRERPRLAGYLIGWIAITCLFWAFQENWEELKMSFLFMALPPMVIFVAYGLRTLTAIGRLRNNLLTLGTIIVAITIFLKFSFYLEFPADDRWYQRFPKAAVNESGLNGLPDDKRLSPEFFLTRETEEERLAVKKRLTAICIFPCRYLPVDIVWPGAGALATEELTASTLSVTNVWDKIYAQQTRPQAP
jgi:hypothetical protein